MTGSERYPAFMRVAGGKQILLNFYWREAG